MLRKLRISPHLLDSLVTANCRVMMGMGMGMGIVAFGITSCWLKVVCCVRIWVGVSKLGHVIVDEGESLGLIRIDLVKFGVWAWPMVLILTLTLTLLWIRGCLRLTVWEIYRIYTNHLHFLSTRLPNASLNRLTAWASLSRRAMEDLGHIQRIVCLDPATLISGHWPRNSPF